MTMTVQTSEAARGIERLEMRAPAATDGADAYRLVHEHGGLDRNSAYAYVLGFDEFGATSLIARDQVAGVLAGFILGLSPPRRPESLFVWQIGVAPDYRGTGLGGRMLDALVQRVGPRFLEATVTPSNAASHALFRAFARRHGVEAALHPAYAAHDFPGGHEAEDRYRIGPLSAERSTLGGLEP